MALWVPPLRTFDSRPGLLNWNPANMLGLSALIGKAQSGQGGGMLAIIGDSIAAGAYADTTTSILRSKAWPARLCTLLNNAGIPATDDNVFGTTNFYSTYSTYNPLLTIGSGWVGFSSGTNCTVGKELWENTTNQNTLSYVPSRNTDSIDIYYLDSTSFDGLTISDGTHSKTLAMSHVGTAIVAKATLGPGDGVVKGANTFTIKKQTNNGTAAFVIGWSAYDSTASQIQVANMAWSGSASMDWNNTTVPWAPANALAAIAPAASILALQVNDWNTGQILATYQANISALLTTLRASGTAIAMTGFPTKNATVPLTTQAGYVAAMKAAAAALSPQAPLLDIAAIFPSWEAADAVALMGNSHDQYHYNGSAYWLAASFVKHAIAPG